MADYVIYFTVGCLAFFVASKFCDIFFGRKKHTVTYNPKKLTAEEVKRTQKMFYEGEG